MSAAPKISFSRFETLQAGTEVIRTEARAIERLAANLPVEFEDAVDLLLHCRGAVIVTGIGKAGWIGQKLSATLASTGTRSHFLHPSEAMHGDLGRVADDDLVLALSNSGESAELLQVMPLLKNRQIRVLALTAKPSCALASYADLTLCYGEFPEAGHLGLAPSTSTALMLALGDALALVVSRRREFQAIDFARNHPGGNLGRSLTNVQEIMRPLDKCRVARDEESVRTVYIRLQRPNRRTGAILLTDERGQLSGLFTDSDLARMLERQQEAQFDQPIKRVMTRRPITIGLEQSAQVAIEMLAANNISELPVVDRQLRPVGLIDITDVLGFFPRCQ